MASTQGTEALRPHLTAGHLSVQIAGHVVGLADVRQNELPDIRVAFTADHQPTDGDPQPFLEHVAAAGTDAVTADVGVVDGGAEERNDSALEEHRVQHRHVKQLTRRLVRIVGDQDVALHQRVRRELVQHR